MTRTAAIARARLAQVAFDLYPAGNRRNALLVAAATQLMSGSPITDIPRELKRLGIEMDDTFEHGLALGATFALALLPSD